MKLPAALLVLILFTAYGLAAIRAFALVEAGFDVSKAANQRLYGAIFFDPLFIFIQGRIFKQKLSDSFDIFCAALIIYIILGRINCFMQGCCGGAAMGASGHAWPIREAEIALNVVLLVIFGVRTYKKKTHGEVYPLYMLIYGAFRFAAEFVREEGQTVFGPIHLAHIWSLISIAAGAAILIMLRRKQSLAASKDPTANT